jgi:hypothetical protein
MTQVAQSSETPEHSYVTMWHHIPDDMNLPLLHTMLLQGANCGNVHQYTLWLVTVSIRVAHPDRTDIH